MPAAQHPRIPARVPGVRRLLLVGYAWRGMLAEEHARAALDGFKLELKPGVGPVLGGVLEADEARRLIRQDRAGHLVVMEAIGPPLAQVPPGRRHEPLADLGRIDDRL